MTETSPRNEFKTSVSLSEERIRTVATSDLFLRLVVGNQQEKTSLWIHLRDASSLTGDPSKWTTSADLINKLWFVNDGAQTKKLSNNFGKVFLENEKNGLRKLLIKFFVFFTYFVNIEEHLDTSVSPRTIRIVIKKSDSFNRVLHAAISFSLSSTNDGQVIISTSISGPNRFEFDARIITQILIEMSETVDLSSRRELIAKQEIMMAAKRAEAEREERRAATQRIKDDLKIRRLKEDLCLDCGQAVIQRRNNRDGHLFFGCSQFVARKCRGAREITCPDCGASMIERNSRRGGTFLGCSRWPNCRGTRSVSSSLERWSNSDDGDESESLDDLARSWGWSNWIEFDDHRE